MAALPYISVQPNYAEVFSDVSSSTIAAEKAWLSYYSSNAPSSSVHAKLQLIQTKDDGSNIETQGGVKIGQVDVSGGPANGLQINRVQGSWLDLQLTQESQSQGSGSGDKRSARTLQPEIELDSGVQVRFPRRTVTKFLPTVGTSKVNDNYTNHPTIDAFDISLGTAEDERDLFVAGGAEGSLYTGRLASDFDASEARALAISSLTSEEQHILTGESLDPEERKWDIEARIRLAVNSAKARQTKKTCLKGHVGDVRFVKFFPSNRVVLSTSSDLTVRIWDPFTGDNPRTLQGHKRAVLTAGILGRGKNVLTAGADGSIRLWDVAAPKQIRLIGSERYSAVQCLALDRQGTGEEEQSAFVTGLASGVWQMMDLRTATASCTVSKFSFPPGELPTATDLWTQDTSAGVTAIDVMGHTVVTGTTNGIVSVWDVRNVSSSQDDSSPKYAPKGLLTTWRRNNAEINSIRLTASPNNGQEVLVATQDGLPYRAAIDAEEVDMQVDGEEPRWRAPRVVHEYAGWDCDPTSWIGLDREGRTVVAGAEGSVRRY
ncbi:26S proteasome regulatory subunit RPN14 [Pseudozyma hubeiensis]|nr:26S proteasome regulatory subunit RPN14 [Pseudozyma hubeiensis]